MLLLYRWDHLPWPCPSPRDIGDRGGGNALTERTQKSAVVHRVPLLPWPVQRLPEIYHGLWRYRGPLYELLKGSKLPKELRQERAYRTLIEKVTSPPVLALPRLGLEYSPDACDYQVGCALFQTHEDGDRKLLGFWFRTLVPAERNYLTTEKEFLAVIYAVQVCRPYLQGERFTIFIDHAALRWLMEINDPSARLMRWRLLLLEFEYDVLYRKGRYNCQADAVSILPFSGHTEVQIDEELACFLTACPDEELSVLDYVMAAKEEPLEPVIAIYIEEILREQQEDTLCKSLREGMSHRRQLPFSEDPSSGRLTRISRRWWSTLRSGRDFCLMVTPRALQAILVVANCTLPSVGSSTGHPWPSTATCARERIKLRRNAKELQLFPATAPLEEVIIDLLGPFQKTRRGHIHLLVMTDRFKELARTVPISRTTAWHVAQAFVKNWVFTYGPPSSLLAENGPLLDSKFLQAVYLALRVRNNFTSTYHPKNKRQVERFNRTMTAALRHYGCSTRPAPRCLGLSAGGYKWSALYSAATPL